MAPFPFPGLEAPVDPIVAAALRSAAKTCRQALVDYHAGLLDEAEVRRAFVRAGVVVTPDDVWLLDVDGGRWWRYRGDAPRAVLAETDVRP